MVNWQSIRRVIPWLGLVLLIVGAKLWLIDSFGSSLPVWDQIDGEGENAIRPFLENRLTLDDLWRPHNEHRIVFTKLYTIALTALNGQWDSYVETVGNAILHALFVPFFLLWIRQRVQGIPFATIASVVTALWILPLDWENTLQGFQSQFYFLIWLSFLQMRGVLESDRFSWKWTFGQLCGLLVLGTMGSGLLSSLAIIAVVGWDCLQTRKITLFQIATLLLSALWATLGLLSRTHVSGHEDLVADSISTAVKGGAEILTWPMHGWLPFSIIFAVPLGWAMWHQLRSRERTAFDRTFVAFTVWFTAIVATIAIFRVQGGALSSRYLDQFIIGLVLQGLALAMIKHTRWRTMLMAGWVAALALTLTDQMQRTWRDVLQPRPALLAQQEANVRAYLATQDPSHLLSKTVDEIPHPSGEVLFDRWQHPSIQRVLPAAVRAPVALPAVSVEQMENLPPTPYPVIAASPTGIQIEPWIWISPRQPATTLPILRFRFSGALGDPESALKMRVVSDQRSTRVTPDGPAKNRWKTINVERPNGEWWIELTDSDSREHMALTAPVELGWLSWFSEKLLKYHAWIVSLGAILLLGGILPGAPRIEPPSKEN
jgi:hypothetical protein